MRAYLGMIAMSGACYSPSSPSAPVDSPPPDVPTAACTPVGHDEDGDQIDDACDLCPAHAAVDVADVDGDGLGAGCDPNPTAADSRWRFESFMGGAAVWTVNAPWVLGTDQLQVDTGNTTTAPYIVIPLTPTALDNFTATTTVLATLKQGKDPQFGFSLVAEREDVNCWLTRRSNTGYVGINWRSDGQDDAVAYADSPFAWVEGGSYQLTIRRRGTSYTCEARAPGIVAELGISSTMVPDMTAGLELWVYQVGAVFKAVFVAGPKL